MSVPRPDTLHHVEIRVSDLRRSRDFWGWFLGRLGYEPHQQWDEGASFRRGDTYLAFVQKPTVSGTAATNPAPRT